MSAYTKKPQRRSNNKAGKWPSLRRELSALKAAQRRNARRPGTMSVNVVVPVADSGAEGMTRALRALKKITPVGYPPRCGATIFT